MARTLLSARPFKSRRKSKLASQTVPVEGLSDQSLPSLKPSCPRKGRSPQRRCALQITFLIPPLLNAGHFGIKDRAEDK